MPDGTLVGVLGLNLDVHYFSQFSTFLEAFVARRKREGGAPTDF